MGMLDWVNDACHSIAGDMGAVTGAAYGVGAFGLTGGNPVAAIAADRVIDHTVETGWHSVCEMPAAINDSLSAPDHSPLTTFPDLG